MDAGFWIERWTANQIGFHRKATHPMLARNWEAEGFAAGERVLVPLCGKSVDMIWLHHRGHPVTGVELSRLAVQAFFDENGLTPQVEPAGALERWSAGDLEVLCGDFFALRPEDGAGARLVYDRAALVALPPEMRVQCAGHLRGLIGASPRMFLITLAYPQHQMAGPPFSVETEEVHRLFGDAFTIRLIEERDVLKNHPNFVARGLTELKERAYILE